MAGTPFKALGIATAAVLVIGAASCKQDAPRSAGTAATTENTTGTTGGSGGSGSGTDIPTLINVNLQNVLNDLSVSLQVNRNSIPVTAQVPIDVAASVCGVSVDALAASVASGNASCTATTTSAQLTQVVQQQISTGGDVTGGDQTTGIPGNTMM
jgi:hypothetical protein